MWKNANFFLSRLGELRDGRSVTKFARDCGIPQQTMAAYCKGDRMPGIEALYQIATTNVVSADWLLGFTDSRTGSAAPAIDPAMAEKLAEKDAEIERLRGEISGLRYALNAVGGASSSRGRARATAGDMSA